MTIVDFATACYQVRTARSSPPALLGAYREHAILQEAFAMNEPDAEYFFVGVTPHSESWPVLVVEQRFFSHQHAFNPSVLVASELNTVFIGAGTRLLAYSLEPKPRQLWEEETEFGFFGWQLHAGVVLMSAELELAAWSAAGAKLWSTFVEPPWSYLVKEQEVQLEVMGNQSRFSLVEGPQSAT
jgi:hypothetical protein